MSKIGQHIETLERRQHFLEKKLSTSSLLYNGRSYDEAEKSALEHVLKIIKETIDEKQQRKN